MLACSLRRPVPVPVLVFITSAADLWVGVMGLHPWPQSEKVPALLEQEVGVHHASLLSSLLSSLGQDADLPPRLQQLS